MEKMHAILLALGYQRLSNSVRSSEILIEKKALKTIKRKLTNKYPDVEYSEQEAKVKLKAMVKDIFEEVLEDNKTLKEV